MFLVSFIYYGISFESLDLRVERLNTKITVLVNDKLPFFVD